MITGEPRIFKKHFKKAFDTLKAIGQMTSTSDSISENALEVMVVLFEMLSSICKKKPEIIKECFECFFQNIVSWLQDLDPEWMSPPEGNLVRSFLV